MRETLMNAAEVPIVDQLRRILDQLDAQQYLSSLQDGFVISYTRGRFTVTVSACESQDKEK